MLDRLDQYSVVWDSPGDDASGSMPIGNGDLAANVWVEKNGDVVLLISKSDAWDENSINLKLGRIRLRCVGQAVTPFRQTLRLRTGDIAISLGKVHLLIWADANHPVIRIDARSDSPFVVHAMLEMWRSEPRTIKTQTSDLFKQLGAPDPHPTIVSSDRVLLSDGRRMVWCHHNEPRELDGYAINMRLQGLGGFLDQMPHPLLGRTFGAALSGHGPEARNAHQISIHALTTSAPVTVDQWQDQLDQVAKSVGKGQRDRHEQWWSQFWQRSWIDLPETPQVMRAYLLQRFMNGCAGRGAGGGGAIKFNGSLFSVGSDDDPDFRRWGGPGFWFQNQRLIYWPMLASGDFDLMMPWLRMYLDMLPLQQHRTRTYFNHGGAHYPETITFWGAEVSAHYGWTPFEQRARPEAESSYIKYYWTGGLELALILLTHYAHTQDDDFASAFVVPIADAVTEFFDLHYPNLRIEPSQALETWQDATNPTPEIAGLRYTLPKLLQLPPALTTSAQRARWERMLHALPPIPIAERDGRRIILPAERFDKLKNKENPELYAVFPFRVFGVGKPDFQLARDTFAARLHKSHECWSQDDIHAACLGLTEEAKQYLLGRAAPPRDSRFPAFWDAHNDWNPDMDHGGVFQLALQLMLMQCEGKRILLLPAWPREWSADFKLHAPFQTIVQGSVRDGTITKLNVTPESRRSDVVIAPPS